MNKTSQALVTCCLSALLVGVSVCGLSFGGCSSPPFAVSGPVRSFQEIRSEALLAKLSAPGWLVVDIRDSDAYNGWPRGEARRGGHIRGAENFSLSWVRANADGLDGLLESKGIHADLSIVVYGDDPEDSTEWAGWLSERVAVPHDRLHVYDGGIAEWSADPCLPMDALARYEMLVPARWVHERAVKEFEQKMRIVDVSWKAEDDYRRGHIPGAVHLDAGELESLPLWNVVSAEKLRRVLLAKGITNETLVVVSGKEITAAARVATILMYVGVREVRLLNGGHHAWLAAGLPLEEGKVEVEPATEFGSVIPARPEYLVGTERAKEILAAPGARLISVRSWAEFTGETSGYGFIQAKGRIPGATWGFAPPSDGRMEDFRNPNHTMRSAREIQRRWRRSGISGEQRLSFYCGTGWRASEAFFCAYVMGFRDISVYDGGWFEWSRDSSNPIAVGNPGAE